MTTISATPMPLPPSALPQGPAKWNQEPDAFARIVYHADPKRPFEHQTGKVGDNGKPVIVTSTTIPFDLFVNHLSSFSEVGSSFDGALAAAAKATNANDVATGVFQSRDGVFYTQQFWGDFPKDAKGDRKFLGIDLPERQPVSIDRGLSDRVVKVDVTSAHPDLKAIVGVTSWVDLRAGAAAVQPAA